MAIRAQIHATGLGVNRFFIIEEGIVRIGSDPVCEIRLDHPLLSPLHAQIQRQDNVLTLTDLDSMRGTRVNGEWLVSGEPRTLASGDEMLLHPYRLSLTLVEVADAAQVAQTAFDHLRTSADSSQAAAPSPTPMVGLSGAPPASLLPDSSLALDRPTSPSDHFLPGLNQHSVRYLNMLPTIYHNDFTSRFLGMLEATLLPIEWTVANFDMFLDPRSAPEAFLGWLSSWFDLLFDPTWSDEQRRTLIGEAQQLFAMRGTAWALGRVLEIYTGHTPIISDLEDEKEPFLFTIKLPLRERDVNRILLERIIDTDKPAHATYKVEFERRVRKSTIWEQLG